MPSVEIIERNNLVERIEELCDRGFTGKTELHWKDGRVREIHIVERIKIDSSQSLPLDVRDPDKDVG